MPSLIYIARNVPKDLRPSNRHFTDRKGENGSALVQNHLAVPWNLA
ncbi:hypothetical protein KNP414_06242 [Paenibacillus mucilaginosus KNP414]|uniref:Uncharacterized protein n=1 Tax=Paenibacillus mucilaginosus (strain KNP414) TaxID=1036673 RepID=F8FK83_PAEMK|nr:hypothetical protein KNP414_06242 [Paenibacillus mucilaginosus KNP414]